MNCRCFLVINKFNNLCRVLFGREAPCDCWVLSCISTLVPICGLLLASILGACSHGASDELPRMVGKNAEQLEKDHKATLKLITKATDEDRLAPRPWHVWNFSTSKNEVRYVVFSGQQIFTIPGASAGSIHLLSYNGTEIGSTDEDLFEIPRSGKKDDWKEGLDLAMALVSSYLQQGAQAPRLKSSRAVTVGFVDGDIEIVYGG
jgi:hypothetical protein